MKKMVVGIIMILFLVFNMFAQNIELNMVKIPANDLRKLVGDESLKDLKNFEMLEHEVTLELYVAVMGDHPENPDKAQNLAKDVVAKRILGGFGIKLNKEKEEKKNYYQEIGIHDNHPVVGVSLYDIMYFCNVLSVKNGLTPVYSVNGETDVNKWDYEPHNYEEHRGKSLVTGISFDENANGYRLPTKLEWFFVTKIGEKYVYPGSDNIDDVAWYNKNSNKSTHEIKQKMPNHFGLYDLTGNVAEFIFDLHEPEESPYGNSCECLVSYSLGGSFQDSASLLKLASNLRQEPCLCTRGEHFGFRLVRTIE